MLLRPPVNDSALGATITLPADRSALKTTAASAVQFAVLALVLAAGVLCVCCWRGGRCTSLPWARWARRFQPFSDADTDGGNQPDRSDGGAGHRGSVPRASQVRSFAKRTRRRELNRIGPIFHSSRATGEDGQSSTTAVMSQVQGQVDDAQAAHEGI